MTTWEEMTMTTPTPPVRMPTLPNPVHREPGRHLRRGPVSTYLYDVHGMLYPKTFVATILFLVAFFMVAFWSAA